MESRDFLKGLLLKRLRIVIKDGRVIDGHFMCTDKGCNIVLSNCEEFLTQEDLDKAEKNKKKLRTDPMETVNVRTLGLAIVPGDAIERISVQEEHLSTEVVDYINKERTVTVDQERVET